MPWVNERGQIHANYGYIPPTALGESARGVLHADGWLWIAGTRASTMQREQRMEAYVRERAAQQEDERLRRAVEARERREQREAERRTRNERAAQHTRGLVGSEASEQIRQTSRLSAVALALRADWRARWPSLLIDVHSDQPRQDISLRVVLPSGGTARVTFNVPDEAVRERSHFGWEHWPLHGCTFEGMPPNAQRSTEEESFLRVTDELLWPRTRAALEASNDAESVRRTQEQLREQRDWSDYVRRLSDVARRLRNRWEARWPHLSSVNYSSNAEDQTVSITSRTRCGITVRLDFLVPVMSLPSGRTEGWESWTVFGGEVEVRPSSRRTSDLDLGFLRVMRDLPGAAERVPALARLLPAESDAAGRYTAGPWSAQAYPTNVDWSTLFGYRPDPTATRVVFDRPLTVRSDEQVRVTVVSHDGERELGTASAPTVSVSTVDALQRDQWRAVAEELARAVDALPPVSRDVSQIGPDAALREQMHNILGRSLRFAGIY